VIPLVDENPTHHKPWATVLLIAVCAVVYFFVQPVGHRDLFQLGPTTIDLRELEFSLGRAAIPCELTHGRPLTDDEVRRTYELGDKQSCGKGSPSSPAHVKGKNIWLGLLYSMFFHGSVAHLTGNMLFLWVFGNNIEDRKGPLRYLLLYLTAGVVATMTHVLIFPNSTLPLIGASGAIAGIMGAYLVWFPKARVKSMIALGPAILFRRISAAWLLGFWFISQFLLVSGASSVAWAAHVGGFAYGALVGLLWRLLDRRSRPRPALVDASFARPVA